MTYNDSNDSLPEPPAIEWMVLHNCLIILLTLIGNALLIYVILTNNRVLRRKKVTPVQKLMLHMCAADMLFAIITMVPTLGITLTVPIFYGPNWLCKLVKMMQVFPLYASAFLLVAISADRYQAICRPLASMRSSAYNRPSLYALMAWTAAFMFATPQLVLFHKNDGDCIGTYTNPMQYAIYVIVFNTVVWLLPSFIAGILYLQVCLAVWRSTRFGTNFNTDQSHPTIDIPNVHTGLQAHQEGARMHSVELDRRRVQTVKLTLTIVAANFLLWTPFCITSVVDALWPQAINPTFATYIMFFGNLNSCMNPWIWFHFNRNQLRRAFPCCQNVEPLLRKHPNVTPLSSIRSLWTQSAYFMYPMNVENSSE